MARKKQKARGTYGDGSIYPKHEIWWAKLPIGNGQKPIVKSSGSKEREDALELLAQLRRERTRGELVAIDAPNALSIGAVLDDYLERKKGKLAAKTISTYRGQIPRLKRSFGLLPIPKLTTDMMSDYRKERAQEEIQCGANAKEGNRIVHRNVGETSINRELGLLRSALRDMAKRYPTRVGKLPHFPMESERGNVRQGFLTEADLVNKLLPELPRHLKLLAVCGFFAAGRKSEWLRLEWSDVDFERMVIHFEKTKNKHPRDVPIVEGLMLDALLEELRLRNVAWPHLNAVFVYDGRPLKGVGDAWEKACARAGLPNLKPHDLRRSAVRQMKRKGVSDSVAMKISGHRTRSMLDRYDITSVEDVQEAGQKLAAPAQKLKRIK